VADLCSFTNLVFSVCAALELRHVGVLCVSIHVERSGVRVFAPMNRYKSHSFVGKRDYLTNEMMAYCQDCGCEDMGDPAELPELKYPRCKLNLRLLWITLGLLFIFGAFWRFWLTLLIALFYALADR
jgi:hypothetical protein